MHKKIKSIFKTSAPYDILESCGLDFGFQDGGCIILSDAFNVWSNGFMSTGMVISRKIKDGKEVDCFEHAVAILGNLYIDSDGVFSKREMISKCFRLEGIVVDRIEKEFSDCDVAGIPSNKNASTMLAGLLGRELGEFSEVKFQRRCRVGGP